MDTSYLTEALQRERVRPEAVIDALNRAQTAFAEGEPDRTQIDQWLTTLRGEAGHLFAPPPVATPPPPDIPAWLSPTEKLARHRAQAVPKTRPQPMALSPAQLAELDGLSPMQRLTKARELRDRKI